jgi:hypothetical protein
MFRFAGQSGSGPLMSNVRPHTNYLVLNAAFGGAGFEFEDLGALGRFR